MLKFIKLGRKIIADLFQIIYVSQPFGYDEAMLMGILLDARRCNQRDDITGALICRHDIYLQLLEGPQDVVQATYARIRRDDRHVDPKMLVAEPVETRIFGKWAMLHDPAKSRIWSETEIADGAVARATTAELRDIFANFATNAAQD